MGLKTKIAIGTLALTAFNSMYTVHEREQAVVKRMGKPVAVVLGSQIAGESVYENKLELFNQYNQTLKDPISEENINTGAGLYFKLPFIESVKYIPNNLQQYDTPADRVQTRDKKSLEMDVFGPWIVDNPLAYLEKLKDKDSAISRLDQIVDPIKSKTAGQYNLIEFVRNGNNEMITSEKKEFEHIDVGREALMEQITYEANTAARPLGVSFPEIRIKRADLPSENEQAVFTRMIAERDRIATQYRSEGKEEADIIKSTADKEADIIKSAADREAEMIRGDGDALATKTYAQAYSQDQDFFRLQRTLDNYSKAFGENTTIVLDPQNGFSEYMKQ